MAESSETKQRKSRLMKVYKGGAAAEDLFFRVPAMDMEIVTYRGRRAIVHVPAHRKHFKVRWETKEALKLLGDGNASREARRIWEWCASVIWKAVASHIADDGAAPDLAVRMFMTPDERFDLVLHEPFIRSH